MEDRETAPRAYERRRVLEALGAVQRPRVAQQRGGVRDHHRRTPEEQRGSGSGTGGRFPARLGVMGAFAASARDKAVVVIGGGPPQAKDSSADNSTCKQ